MAPGRRGGAGDADAGLPADPDAARADSDARAAGPPALIPHSRPLVGDAEVDALRRVVESGMLAQGPRVEELERAVAALVGGAVGGGAGAIPAGDGGSTSPTEGHGVAGPAEGHGATGPAEGHGVAGPAEGHGAGPAGGRGGAGPARQGVALSSGTAALYVALRCLDVGSAAAGDEVLIPAYGCMSLAQAVRYVGASPVYVDCRPGGWNPDPEDARAKLTDRTRAVIVVHLFGLPADVEPFRELGVPVIEDCAQTLGVDAGGRPVGSRGDLTVCSFYATKLVAGGEGGMLLSRDRDRAETARGLRDCEDDRADDRAFNFKMSDLHAAVALTQLRRLPRMLERRRELASRYRKELDDLPVELPAWPDGRDHAWFRFVVDVGEHSLEDLLARAEARGVACRRPVGRLPAEVRRQLDTLPGCRAAWERACSIPLYPGLRESEVEAVLERFRATVEEMQ